MRKSFIFKMALRNIMARKLRSTLTILGIAIGVGFIVFLVSLGFGLQRISTTQIANIQALQVVDVTPGKSKIIKIDDQTIQKFEKIANVTSAEPGINIGGNLYHGTSTVEGVVYGKNKEFLEIESPELLFGGIYQSNFDKSVLVNQSALRRMGLGVSEDSIGKRIKVKLNIGPEYFEGNEETVTREEDFTITGVLKNDSSPYVYLPLETFRSYEVKYFNTAKLQINNKLSTDGVKKELESMGFKPTSLKDTVDQINQFFAIFQLVLLSFGVIAVLVAILGMFNTLTISLLEKTREISFMKILGTTKKDIWRLFLFEALLIGFVGSVIGISGGILTGTMLNNILIVVAENTNNKPVTVFYTPVLFAFGTFFATIFLSFLTGVYPSFRASRIDPLEAMRYE